MQKEINKIKGEWKPDPKALKDAFDDENSDKHQIAVQTLKRIADSKLNNRSLRVAASNKVFDTIAGEFYAG